jgi:hypothetical protein
LEFNFTEEGRVPKLQPLDKVNVKSQLIDSVKLKSRIYGGRRGGVFSPNDFLDLGGRDAVDKALSRLTAKRTIRRLARGPL